MSLQDAISAVAAEKHLAKGKKKGKPQASKRGRSLPPAFLKKGAKSDGPNAGGGY